MSIESFNDAPISDVIFREYLFANSVVPQASDVIKICSHLVYIETASVAPDLRALLTSDFSESQYVILLKSLDNQHLAKGIPYLSTNGWELYGHLDCYKHIPIEERKTLLPNDLHKLWQRVTYSLVHNLYYFTRMLTEGVHIIKVENYLNNLESDLNFPTDQELSIANSFFSLPMRLKYSTPLKVARQVLGNPRGKEFTNAYRNEFESAKRHGSEVWREQNGYRKRFAKLVRNELPESLQLDPQVEFVLNLNHLEI